MEFRRSVPHNLIPPRIHFLRFLAPFPFPEHPQLGPVCRNSSSDTCSSLLRNSLWLLCRWTSQDTSVQIAGFATELLTIDLDHCLKAVRWKVGWDVPPECWANLEKHMKLPLESWKLFKIFLWVGNCLAANLLHLSALDACFAEWYLEEMTVASVELGSSWGMKQVAHNDGTPKTGPLN